MYKEMKKRMAYTNSKNGMSALKAINGITT